RAYIFLTSGIGRAVLLRRSLTSAPRPDRLPAFDQPGPAVTVDTAADTKHPTRFVEAIAELQAAFGNRVVTSRALREQHGNTVTWIANQAPDAVVYPQSTEDVQQVVRICAKHGMPIIPFGTG